MDAKAVDTLMAEAIRLAEEGMHRGDGGPFGALVLQEGTIIGRGWNRVLATNDPTAHAEMVAIREACSRIGNYWLEGCTLVVNCEPCPMCLAAIYWARIASVIYGATRDDAAAIGFDDARFYAELSLPAERRQLGLHQHGREEAVRSMQSWLRSDTRKDY